MDLSGVIFAAVALAWAAYLIPQALKHHDEAVQTRSVERFSATMRVLVRRGAASGASGSGQAAEEVVEPVAAPTPAQLRARRAAARRAMQRRRRVLGVLVTLLVAGVVLAVTGVIARGYVAAPVVLLGAWLVTCRVMVKGELAAWNQARGVVPVVVTRSTEVPNAASSEADLVAGLEGYDDGGAHLLEANAETGLISAVSAEGATELSRAHTPGDPAETRDPRTLWDPVAVPLPTYVSKDHAAARELPAFDFDDTGVFSSGRDQADSELVRRERAEAEERRTAQQAELDDHRRAVGH
ncbi:hypothetical protein QE364_002700 [Nocardioides zeae]|uniref:Uncharacterized protein n=2 Tax=Nocardioides zeae TaxID=1457234 RepID=A0AAJ1U9B7_9ACTN|nr:hypothetical protein [Nocardioides zeae]MDQ1106766.1 hypothetical protein [Nocardioides zeae]MDR6173576.1 hypothetical protein [Nocardioides zeae]MDR6210981.1 hypothetical protein [Nocardioides zeae]